MRFAPGLALAAAPALAGRRAATPPRVPDGLLAPAAALFDDLSTWTLDPDWSDAGGAVQKAPGAANAFVTSDPVAIPAGDIWVGYTVRGATAGTVGVQLQGPFANTPMNNKVTAQQVARFSGPAHTGLRLIGNMGFDGAVEDLQAVDMTALLAEPSDIYLFAGQSLISAEASSTPVDPDLDRWEPRCLYIPGHGNATYGTVAGTVAACVPPLQMRQTAQGVSPAPSFAREVAAHTPQGRTVTIVGAARGGSSLIGPDAAWNPDGDTGEGGTLYSALVADAQAALARTPGSRIVALVWGQGESDRSASIATAYPPAFATMVARLRQDLGLPGLPVIVLGGMPDDDNAFQPDFLQMQAALDQDSGQPTAMSGVHHVARPAGYLSADGTHPEPEGNRIAGRLAAARLRALGYI